jgi:hypothetical protein
MSANTHGTTSRQPDAIDRMIVAIEEERYCAIRDLLKEQLEETEYCQEWERDIITARQIAAAPIAISDSTSSPFIPDGIVVFNN